MTDTPKPPVAATRPHAFQHHNVRIEDPWAWLRDPRYPKATGRDIRAYLGAENAYFREVMAPLKPLSRKLFKEMRGRIKEDDATVPQKDGDWIYWTDFETGGEYRRWWRKPAAGGEDQLVLDEPALAKGKKFFRLGAIAASPDGRWLAYAVDDNGSERFTVRVKDLETGALLPDTIDGMLSEIVWTARLEGLPLRRRERAVAHRQCPLAQARRAGRGRCRALSRGGRGVSASSVGETRVAQISDHRAPATM